MKIIAGLFDSLEAAEQAKTALLQAAEAPGQSYENQTGEDPDTAKFAEAVRGSVCVVSVKVDSRHQAALAAALLRRHGARGGVLRFPRSREW